MSTNNTSNPAVVGDDLDGQTVVTAEPVESRAPVPSGANVAASSGAGVPEYLYYGLAFASFQLLVISCYDCDYHKRSDLSNDDCEDKQAYAVAASALSNLLLLVHFLVKLVPQISAQCACWQQFCEPFLAIVLWVLWVISLAVLTMPDHESDHVAPYVSTGSGWLMTWLATAISTLMVAPAFEGWHQQLIRLVPCFASVGPAKEASSGMLLAVALLSLTVMWCCADLCDKRDNLNEKCDGVFAWGLLVSLVSLCYTIVMLLCGHFLDSTLSGMVVKIMSLCLAIWWWLGATVITVTRGDDGDVFHDSVPANGFWGTWLAFAFSAAMAASQFGLVDIKHV